MKPRVLLISEIPTPYRIPLFRQIAESGSVELTVLFCAMRQPDRPWDVERELAGFRHETMRGISIPFRTRRNSFVYEVNPGVAARLMRRDFDVLVIGGYSVFAEQFAIAFAQLTGIPYVLHVESHSNKPRSRARRELKAAILPRVIAGAAAGLATGSAAARYLEQYGLERGRIRIVPNTIDIVRYASLAADSRERAKELRERFDLPERYLLYAGRLIEDKGIMDLVAALGRLGAAAPEVVVAGAGPLEPQLKGRPKIHLIGFQGPDRLIDLYALAAATVVPSRNEPWGVVVNEALACGCPVIATSSVGAAEDLILDGENGAIVPPGDIDALAAAIAVDRSRPQPLVGRIGEWTYAFAVEQFLEAIGIAVR